MIFMRLHRVTGEGRAQRRFVRVDTEARGIGHGQHAVLVARAAAAGDLGGDHVLAGPDAQAMLRRDGLGQMRDIALAHGIDCYVMATGGSVLADTEAAHLAQTIPPEHRLGVWACQ
ncbi:MAG: hypothetical protein AAFW46_19175, partial [Pseudomonadota bacterium]